MLLRRRDSDSILALLLLLLSEFWFCEFECGEIGLNELSFRGSSPQKSVLAAYTKDLFQ
jgi:hypothetical protein